MVIDDNDASYYYSMRINDRLITLLQEKFGTLSAAGKKKGYHKEYLYKMHFGRGLKSLISFCETLDIDFADVIDEKERLRKWQPVVLNLQNIVRIWQFSEKTKDPNQLKVRISQIKHGKDNITLITLHRLARFLRRDPSELVVENQLDRQKLIKY